MAVASIWKCVRSFSLELGVLGMPSLLWGRRISRGWESLSEHIEYQVKSRCIMFSIAQRVQFRWHGCRSQLLELTWCIQARYDDLTGSEAQVRRSSLSLLEIMHPSVRLLELLKGQECDDCRRCPADESWEQTLEHPAQTFMSDDPAEHDWNAVHLGGRHETSLDYINWAEDKGRSETSETACCQMGWKLISH